LKKIIGEVYVPVV